MNDKLISKNKLPKGLSYPLQTKDIEGSLETEFLSLIYYYAPDNPKEFKWTTIINLLTLHEKSRQLEHLIPYDYLMSVYSVNAKLRKKFRDILVAEVLPYLRKWQDANHKGRGVSVYYHAFHASNWPHLDFGGIYIEADRYKPQSKMLYRNKDFNIDEDLKVIYENK
jgi:hypothetical protein